MNNHTHPMIFMRGTNSNYLANVLDYIYHGEVNIDTKDLESLFALVTELQIEGKL